MIAYVSQSNEWVETYAYAMLMKFCTSEHPT